MIDKTRFQWEFPIVPQIRKLDSRRRAVFPERFAPGDLFFEEDVGDDRVVFLRVKPADVPLAKVEKRNGCLMIRAKIDPARIAAAIREDRDRR